MAARQTDSPMAESRVERLPGRASSSDCPRRSYIYLRKDDQSIVVPTTCKTWGCLSCRDRVKMYVKLRMEHGLSTDEPGYLTTVTYRMGTGRARTAACVSKDWARLCRLITKRHPQLAWFKIPELTKRGQVHLHTMMTGLGSRTPCCIGKGRNGKCAHRWTESWVTSDCQSDCLEHQLASFWLSITGDSFVVDSRLILGPSGAANYLVKYLTKSFDSRSDLEALGFHRRWSCSRNWPSPQRLQFKHTRDGTWSSTHFISPKFSNERYLHARSLDDQHSPLAERVGSPLAHLAEAKRKRHNTKKLLRRFQRA